jgi:hypothetical protein
MTEVYVDNFISLLIGYSREQDPTPSNNPVSLKKLLKGDGDYRSTKSILGFEFDGVEKTIWLEEDKRMTLLTILKSWLRTASRSRHGIKFKEFESIIAKVRHAFTVLPEGRGLLSPCHAILHAKPNMVYLQHNPNLREAICCIRTLLDVGFSY